MGGGGDGLALEGIKKEAHLGSSARGHSIEVLPLSPTPAPAATIDAGGLHEGDVVTPESSSTSSSGPMLPMESAAVDGAGKLSSSSASAGTGPEKQQQQQPPAKPRSIYEGKEHIPFWDGPLLVAIAANLLWPALLLLLTGWSMLIVLFFRLERLVVATLLRRPSSTATEGEGKDDAPVDVGLYWFGYDNHCEKWETGAAGGTHHQQQQQQQQQQHRHFDPRKPSVIYVHGFARRTTARRFRETFNWAHNDEAYGLDINAADAWIAAGWNVGIFYWNQLADEEMPQDTESKIWTSNGRTGMRYRTICPKKGTLAFYTPKEPAPSISQRLADVLAEVFRGAAAPYRLVGHSLGTQVVVHASTLLLQRQGREEAEAEAGAGAGERGGGIVLPTRIALLDVFGTLGIKAYLSGWPIMAVVQRELVALRARGVVLEQYQSSLIGRRGLWFRHLTAFIQLDPAHIPWWRLRSRHIAAVYMYFLSFGHAAQGPPLKKADLRRHQSATIMLAAARRASMHDLARDDSGTINLSWADLLASSTSGSGGKGGGAMGASESGEGGTAKAEEGTPRPLSSSSLGLSGGGSKGGAAPPASSELPFRTTITRIIQRRRLSSSSSSLPSSLGHHHRRRQTARRGGSGAAGGSLLDAVTDETVAMIAAEVMRVEQRQQQGQGKESITTATATATTRILTTETAMTTTATMTMACPSLSIDPARYAQQPTGPEPPPQLPAPHFVPYKDKAESRNHIRWLLTRARVGLHYREVEVGSMPLMARATDEEIRELMECGYVYKQHRGHLFLRVARPICG